MAGYFDSPGSAPQPQRLSSPLVKPAQDSTRVRSSRACTHCSHRKAKCDGNQPCSSCARGRHECVYTTPRKRGPPKGAPARGGVKKRRAVSPSDEPSSAGPRPQLADFPSSTNQRDMPSTAAVDQGQTLRQPAQHPNEHFAAGVGVGVNPLVSHHGHPNGGSRLPAIEDVLSLNSVDAPLSRSRRSDVDSVVDGLVGATRPRDLASWDIVARDASTRSRSNETGVTAVEPSAQWRPTNEPQTSVHPPLNWKRPGHLPGRAYSHGDGVRDYDSSAIYLSRPSTNTHLYSQDPALQVQHSYAQPRIPPMDAIGSAATQQSNGPGTYNRYLTSAGSPNSLLTGGLAALQSASSPPALAQAPSPHSSWLPSGPRGSFSPRAPSLGHGPATSYNYHRQLPSSAAATSYERSSGGDAVPRVKRESAYPSPSERPHDDSPGTSFYTSTNPGVEAPVASPPPGPASEDGPDHGIAGRRGARDGGSPRLAEDHLPDEVIKRLLDIYQAFIHPHWPIIYLPSINSLHSLRTEKPVLFEAILAVASATFDSNADTSDPDLVATSQFDLFLGCPAEAAAVKQAWTSGHLCRHFVNRVKQRILDGRFEKDIATIQASILLSVVEMGLGNNSSAWHLSGIAVRTALDMNLHRPRMQATGAASGSASTYPGVAGVGNGTSNAELQEQKRVLWASYILDKVLATVLEKPVQLRHIDIETDMPSVYERDEYDLWLNDTTRPFVPPRWLHVMEGVKVHAISSFYSWAQVMGILEHILDGVYSPRARSERRRTNGEADRAVLARLDEALQRWRLALPPHLQWTDPPVAGQQIVPPGADRPGIAAHRGVGPHILTVRGWYCICVILLHRPRVPQLLTVGKAGWSAKARGSKAEPNGNGNGNGNAARSSSGSGSALHDFSSVPLQPQMQNIVSPLSPSFHGGEAAADSNTASTAPQPSSLTAPGLEICSLAAKEVCDILHVYSTTFRIRKIPSSWVYLIFQSATIHSALAPGHAARAHRRHESRLARRQHQEPGPSGGGAGRPGGRSVSGTSWSSDEDEEDEDEDSLQSDDAWTSDPGRQASMKESERYLSQCLKFLNRIGPTWQIASHHVKTLQRLCVASAKTRPSSPIRTFKAEDDAAGRTEKQAARHVARGVGDSTDAQSHGAPSLDTAQGLGVGDGSNGHDGAHQLGGSTDSALHDLAQEAVRFRDGAELAAPVYASSNVDTASAPVGDATGLPTALPVAQMLQQPQPQPQPQPQLDPQPSVPCDQAGASLVQPDLAAWANYCAMWDNMPLSSENPAMWDSFVRDIEASSAPQPQQAQSQQPLQQQQPWFDQSAPGGGPGGGAGGGLNAMPRWGGVGLASTDPHLTAFLHGETWVLDPMQPGS
ncbi:uncharacterized protein PFL1_06678 [Pseudozyma flocculosa PF-1]|uniref:Zn(2)-C6 fungal-type domain-containing protein n=2 Tax=Pseudozyma flocculosa TaxID=84751 RepID=A0A5C3F7N8_9BASI|nr:uncharacterized protein PFL1_06678 [Pseudozyma flocculosa PF-1]EPQ25811.1 hypothetical protein PFL1_06678 [Pseudozyma flocculosa PF-1]SPO40488.1 uncharacterized protein PSFLO_05970 [Pseudozyma flocculosa]